MRPRTVNLSGRRFGRLSVVGDGGRDKQGGIMWLCLCDCGATVHVRTTSLTKDKFPQVSCGCHRREALKAHYLRQSRPVGEAAFSRLLLRYRSNARSHEVLFALTLGHFRYLTSGDCFYCGTPPAQSVSGFRNGDYQHNGVDRIVPSRGYVADNVRSCCKTCNIAKHDLGEVEFYIWIKRVHAHIATFISETSTISEAPRLKVKDAPRTGEIVSAPLAGASAS